VNVLRLQPLQGLHIHLGDIARMIQNRLFTSLTGYHDLIDLARQLSGFIFASVSIFLVSKRA
jgi:hypothetical protein